MNEFWITFYVAKEIERLFKVHSIYFLCIYRSSPFSRICRLYDGDEEKEEEEDEEEEDNDWPFVLSVPVLPWLLK